MIKQISDRVYYPIVFFLLVQTFIPNEAFWFLGFVFCLYIVAIKEHMRIKIPFKSYWLLILFFIWGIFLGTWMYASNQVDFHDFLRDIFYYSTSFIYIYIGAYYARKRIDLYSILNSFIIAAACLSAIYLFQLLTQGASYLLSSDVHGWRSVTGGGAVVIGISIAFFLSDIIPQEKTLPKPIRAICVILTGTYFIVALSRTNLLIVILMTLILTLRKDNLKEVMKRKILVIVLAIVAIWLMSVLLPAGILRIYITKILDSLTEMSINNNWDAASVQKNWRGYENYSALKLWKDSALLIQLFGYGFGKRIYVGRFAYSLLGQLMSDGSRADSIAVLHNGYATQLIKLGVLGTILYVVFYISIIIKAIKDKRQNRFIEARVLLAVGVTLLIQTYYLHGLFRDYCFYPFVILLGYTSYKLSYIGNSVTCNVRGQRTGNSLYI